MKNPHVAPVHYSDDRIVSPVHHIQGCDRNQTLLLPNSVDDYIGPDNPIRFVDAFVEQLDLQGVGFFRVEPKETGRPGYHPADLLKLYIYGYLNRVRSSRRLKAESRRNLEVMWLLRGLTPDFQNDRRFSQGCPRRIQASLSRVRVAVPQTRALRQCTRAPLN